MLKARGNQEFVPESAGSEIQQDSLAQRAEPSASASRAPQLFLARTSSGVGSCSHSLSWQAASVARESRAEGPCRGRPSRTR
eukprot:5386770-Alexandrium_andersonii.AAC.1